MLRYFMDHHVHSAITSGLRTRSIDCLTLQEDGAQTFEDAQVLNRATLLERVLVTQDEDFLEITSRLLSSGEQFAGVVYSEQLGITIGQAISDLELIAHVLTREEIANQVLRIPL